jgi:hypothetical protein
MQGSKSSTVRALVRNTPLEGRFYIETINSPRQARDNKGKVETDVSAGKYKQYENLTAAIQGQMPLFFGTTTNSYGRMLKQYVDKIFALGLDGVYHDGYAYSAVTYTYGTWDNVSCFLNPADLSIRALPGSLQLLSMPLEVELQAIIKANGGFFTANGSPRNAFLAPFDTKTRIFTKTGSGQTQKTLQKTVCRCACDAHDHAG